MPVGDPPAFETLDRAVSALGGGLLVHLSDGPAVRFDSSGDEPDLPAGIRAVPAEDAAAEAGPDVAILLRPSKVSRFRTLDSASYTSGRFDGDFVRLVESRGMGVHDAMREVLREADPKARPFRALCLLTRRLADRALLDRGLLDPQGSRRTWSAILGSVGYDILVDRDGAVLPGGGTQVLVMREGAVRPVATAPAPPAHAPPGP